MEDGATPFREPPGTIYARLLCDYWRQRDEEPLTRAADLGKALVHAGLPPEEIGEFQQQALLALAAEWPVAALDEAAARLTPPLIEVLMAYGLAFREQLIRNYQHMVEQHLEKTSKVLMVHGLAFREQIKHQYERTIEKRLEQTSKLQALGTLASGIAHDFNTILGVILGYTEMTLELVPEDSDAGQNLRQITVATLRARDLIARILTFGRHEEGRRLPVRLADGLNDCLTMLRVTMPPSIRFETQIAQPDLTILADPNEWQQLVMDLTINAVDAMDKRGVVIFLLDTVVLTAEPSLPPGINPGEYARLRIRDTGRGIPPEIMDRIFEPFFTTKEIGKGSGLGLSVVYGIVQRMGGIINVASQPDQGTEFEVLCPCQRVTNGQESPDDHITAHLLDDACTPEEMSHILQLLLSDSDSL